MARIVRNKAKVKKRALQNVKSLFEAAEKIARAMPDLAKKYVEIAAKVSMKARVSLPKEHKMRRCKACLTYLIPGENCRIRTRKQHLVYRCQACKHINRYGYK